MALFFRLNVLCIWHCEPFLHEFRLISILLLLFLIQFQEFGDPHSLDVLLLLCIGSPTVDLVRQLVHL